MVKGFKMGATWHFCPDGKEGWLRPVQGGFQVHNTNAVERTKKMKKWAIV
jgi:hypothetical protein